MPWQILLLFSVIITYCVHPIAVKKNAGMHGRTQRLVLMFLFNAIIAWILAIVLPFTLVWDYRVILILGVGMLNSVANYAHWRAMDVSVTRTSILAQGDDIIAMALAYVFLGETSILTTSIAIGVTLCMGCAIAVGFLRRANANATPEEKTKERGFLIWVAIYCTIWGIAVFSHRALGVGNMPVVEFLAAWYSGSVVGALVLKRVMRGKEEAKSPSLRSTLWLLAICATSLTGLGFAIWTKSIAPITIVQPILQVAESILPALVGLILFKEAKQIGWTERAILALGVAGSVVLGFSTL